ncbi:MAG: hypothetical protein ACYC0V_06535 [Armatimonadota bacterium]
MKTQSASRMHVILAECIIMMAIACILPVYASSVPPADVVKEAHMFVPNAVYKYTTKGAYVFGKNGMYVFVDAKTQRVNNFFWDRSVFPVKKTRIIDINTAEKKVRAFIKERRIDTTGWLLLVKKPSYHVNDELEYTFEFGKKSADGQIDLPSHINISIDSYGNMREYYYNDSPVTISLNPRYTRSELINIAMEATKQKNPKLKSFDLSVRDRYGEIKKQMLLAEIWLRGEPTTKISDDWATDQGFIINAHTGEIISTLGIAGH